MIDARQEKGGDDMGRIFKLKGNFTQSMKWANEKSPAFVGEIVIEDDGTFHGYCDELYESDAVGEDRTRYLAGMSMGDGIAFYKLSNLEPQLPLFFLVPKVEETIGYWATFSVHGCFKQGAAVVVLEEQPYSKESEDVIKGIFSDVDRTVNRNYEYLDEVQRCQDVLDSDDTSEMYRILSSFHDTW